jgi:iron complex outermembrane receptor protein
MGIGLEGLDMYNTAKGKGLGSNCVSTFCFAFISILAALIICPPVWAADDEKDKKSTNIGDITVTSTKMSTEVDKMPTNITVISREEIEKYPGHYNAITLLRDLNIPGLFFPISSVDVDIAVSSRGSDVSNWGMRAMINGIELNNGNGFMRAGRLAVHDIERIEITKTPSAVFGDQAIGGVINIITRVAKEPLEGKAGIAYNSLKGGNGYGVINGSQENWEYYLDASLLRENSYQDGGYFDINNVYTMVKYNLNDNSNLAFHGSYKDSEGNYTASLTREQFDEDPTQNPNDGADYYFKTEESLSALVYEQKLGRHEFMCKVEVQSTSWKSYGDPFYMTGDSLVAHPEARMTFNHEIAGMANKLVIGGEYRYHDLEAKRYDATSYYDIGTKNRDFSRQDISYTGYMQDELRITDALTITAGIRYDYFDLDQVANIASSTTWSNKTGAFSPKIGLTYQLCNEVNLFAGFNSGIKSPVRLRQWFTNGELEPEKLYSYEVGVRGNISNWLDYNMAVFWQKVTDKFVRPTADFWTSEYENAGETSAKGVEMGAHARLPHGFYASTSFTYQESKFDEFVSGGVDYSGNYLTGVPDMMFSMQLGYRNDMFGDISLNPVYTGKRYFNYANTNEEDGFWVLNARYAKKIGQTELFVLARNIFDVSAVGSGGGDPGAETLYPISGFNAVVGLNVTF